MNSRALPLSVVNSRLAAKGYTLVGDYTGARHRSTLRCEKGHEWVATVDNVIKVGGTGCPHCSGRAQLTLQEIAARLSGRGLKMLGDNPRSALKSTFSCSHGHQWIARVSSVIQGDDCPQCKPCHALTIDEVNHRIASRGYTVAGSIVNGATKTTFRCSHGHEWAAIPDNILRGRGCPSCADYGFNPGLPAYFYTMHLMSDSKNYVGFGITRDMDTRYASHERAAGRKGFSIKVLDLYSFVNGSEAKELEDTVKAHMPITDTGIPGFRKEAIEGDIYPNLVKFIWNLQCRGITREPV
jgi:predicted GIY-YIG superfamily endonuclease